MAHRKWFGVNLVCSIIMLCSSSAQQTEGPAHDETGVPENLGWTNASKARSKFTAYEREFLLETFNNYRRCVTPSATDMKQLTWDEQLEHFAIMQTSGCTGSIFRYEASSERMKETWNPAENLFIAGGNRYNLEVVLNTWWDERENYVLEKNMCKKESCLHYLNMVFGKATKLGCGMSFCDSFSENSAPTPATQISCFLDEKYDPEAPPYTAGERGADCNKNSEGLNFQAVIGGLCSTDITEGVMKESPIHCNTTDVLRTFLEKRKPPRAGNLLGEGYPTTAESSVIKYSKSLSTLTRNNFPLILITIAVYLSVILLH